MALKSQILNLKSQILFTLSSKLAKLFPFIAILLFISTSVFSRHFVNNSYNIADILNIVTDTPEVAPTDTMNAVKAAAPDSEATSDGVKSKVVYSARDSIRMDAGVNKVYLYGDAKIHYQDIDLKADQIIIDWSKKEVFAEGITDTSGKVIGNPEFTEADQTFKATTMRYNFNTKKGKITYVTSKEGEGYIHGETVKKDSSDNLYIRNGKYTTCDLDTPHYYIGTNRLKIINKKRVVTGPAYLVIEDVPTPFVIPFGYFPNSRGRSSGIIFPAYGESVSRGFYLQKLGYYFGISDNLDAALTGDVYTKGSYLVNGSTQYYARYKYRGNFNFSYSYNITSEPELPDYAVEKDFHITWQHTQDPKARPGSIFSANVNAGTSNFYQANLSTPANYLSNTFNSSISWSKSLGSKANLVTSITHSQNTVTHDLSLSAPNVSFSLARITPFQSETGVNNWYNNIGFSYSVVAENRITTKDSLLFKKATLDSLNYGMEHIIPISTSIKVLKYATLTPNVTYTERIYPTYTVFSWDSVAKKLDTTTVHQIRTEGDYIASASLATKIYGMYLFNSGSIVAIRHVMTPTIGLSYRPDYGGSSYGIYRTVQSDTNHNVTNYSIYQNNLYGSPGSGRYGFVSFGLDNNVEMKVRTKSDTGSSVKKLKIFESLSINSGYNLAVDSFNLANFNVSGRTMLFNLFNLQLSGVWDPYALDSAGIRINKFELNEDGKLARLTSADFDLGFSLNRKNKKVQTSNKATEEELRHINEHPEDFVDFNIPWNVTVDYNIGYATQGFVKEPLTQTARFNGELLLTSKWKIGFNSGYDFTASKFSYTSINIYRDMHCWEMKFNWIPFGAQESYNFQINVKASVLQDLKLIKKTDFYDR